MKSNLYAAFLALFALFTGVSCKGPRPGLTGETLLETGVAQSPAPILFEWNGDSVQGPLSITIDLSEQKAQIFKGKTNVGWTYVATGLSTHPTPRGNFRIMERKIDKTSNKYGVIENAEGQIIDFDAAVGREKVPPGCRYVPAPMPYWMRLTSYGVGMHQGPIPDPGSPASHGCIRMPEEMARNLFFASKNGTPVTIKP